MSCPRRDAKHCGENPECPSIYRVSVPVSVIRVDGSQAQAAVRGLDHTCPVENVGEGGPPSLQSVGHSFFGRLEAEPSGKRCSRIHSFPPLGESLCGFGDLLCHSCLWCGDGNPGAMSAVSGNRDWWQLEQGRRQGQRRWSS